MLSPAVRRLLLCSLGWAALAQPAAFGIGTLEDEIEVRLVTLDVLVSRADGEPVLGLERDSFELLRDGLPVAITTFVPPRPDPGSTRESGGPGSEARGLTLVVYVDFAFLQPGQLEEVVADIQRFLQQEVGPGARFLLLSANQSLEIDHGLAESPDPLTVRLGDLAPKLGRSRVATEYRQIVREIENALGARGRRSGRIRDALPSLLRDRISSLAADAYRQIEQSVVHLERTITLLEGLPGRREMILVSGTPPLHVATGLHESWRRAFGRGSSYAAAGSPDGGGVGAGTGRGDDSVTLGLTTFDDLPSELIAAEPSPLIERAVRRAALAGVRIHTLELHSTAPAGALLDSAVSGDLSAAVGMAGVSTHPAADQGVESRDALRRLSTGTSGRSLVAGPRLAAQLAALGRDLRSSYLLGFIDSDEQGGEHELEARLAHVADDLEVRHVRSYRTRSVDQVAAAATISALLLGRGDNRLDVIVEVEQATAARDGTIRVPITVRVPLANLALAAERRSHTGRLSIFSTAGGVATRPVPVGKSVLPVRLPNRDLLTALGRLVEYSFELAVPADAERLAVGVRDDLAQITATVVHDL